MKKEVVFVSQYCCIRAIKMAMALRKEGYKVHLITNARKSGYTFDSVSIYDDPSQLDEAIKLHKNIGLFHVHNEPNWPAMNVRECVPNAKIVMDVHDSHYWRFNNDKKWVPGERFTFYEEDYSYDCSDALVFPSEYAMKDFEIRGYKQPKTFVLAASMLSQYRYKQHDCFGGLVSQGGHIHPSEKIVGEIHYRDYTELYTALKGKRQVYAYSQSFKYLRNDGLKSEENKLENHYIELGVKLGKFAYDDLIDVIGGHTWNLVGRWPEHHVYKYSVPNKFFDAIAAGIPSVAFGIPEVEKIIEKYDIGIVCKDPDELIERWGEHREKRKNLMLARKELSMEKQIPKLIKLYESL